MRIDINEVISCLKRVPEVIREDVYLIEEQYSIVLVYDDQDKMKQLTHGQIHDLYLMFIDSASPKTDRISFAQYIIDHIVYGYTEYEIVETQQLNPHENQLPQASPHHSTNALGLGI